jgi:hypothetical protein
MTGHPRVFDSNTRDMTLSSWPGKRIALLTVGWIVGLPFLLFVILQAWVFLPHDEGMSHIAINLFTVLLVLLGPPFLLVISWAIARWRASGDSGNIRS